jgi:hypothetical protein
MLKKILLVVIGICLVGGIAAYAQVPQLINFQGRLTGIDRKAITTSRTFDFSLVGSKTGWKKEGISIMPDSNGVFSVDLAVTAADLEDATGLLITVNGQQLGDPQPLTSVPYALVAESLAGWGGKIYYRYVKDNLGLGRSALNPSITGDLNTSLGYRSGLNLTTGMRNTFVGAGAGNFAKSGNENTTVGYYAGQMNETGVGNTLVGYIAGSKIKGDRNICLGYKAGANATGSDQLYIGTDQNTLIYGEMDSGVLMFNAGGVGINVTRPATDYRLHVGGDVAMTRKQTGGETRTLIIGGARSLGGNDFARIDLQNYDSNNAFNYTGARISSQNDGQVKDGDLRFYTANNGSLTQQMKITSTGRIGIGATSPGAALHLKSGTTPLMKIEDAGGRLAFLVENPDGDKHMTVIKASGKVGIGTDSPTTKLHVVEGDSYLKAGGTYGITTKGTNYGVYAIGKDFDFFGKGDSYFGGKVGIGVQPPLDMLHVTGGMHTSTGVRIGNTASASGAGQEWSLRVGAGSSLLGDKSFGIVDQTANKTRLVIKSDGKVGIGTTATSYRLNVSGDIYAANTLRSGNLYTKYSKGATLKLGAGGSIIASTSDRRKKTNLREINDALGKVVRLKGYSFNWIEEPNGKRAYGLIAQDVQNVIPEVVHDNPTGYMGVDYEQLVAVLAEAVKELKTENDDLKARIEKLEAK